MSVEDQELGWDQLGEGFGYGTTNNQKKGDDFNDIKITLNDYNDAKYGSSDSNNNKNYDALRPSSVSSGDNNLDDAKPQKQGESQDGGKGTQWFNCFQIEFYRQYFDVTTNDVIQRLKFSWIPVGDGLSRVLGENPDFYGPFWIYTSLIFTLAFSENFHNYLLFGEENFASDFGNVIPSFITIYGIGFGLPLGLSFLLKYFVGGDLKFREIASIYGYSFAPISICIALWSIPFSLFQWICIGGGLGVNLMVLFLNLKKHLDSAAPKSKWIVIGVVWGTQVLLMLIFKFIFMHEIYKDK